MLFLTPLKLMISEYENVSKPFFYFHKSQSDHFTISLSKIFAKSLLVETSNRQVAIKLEFDIIN